MSHGTYPTMEEVESADREQLCRWNRFLPSPGNCAIGKSDDTFARAIVRESKILKEIIARLAEMGGFTPEISKKIGWGEQ